MAKSRVLTVNVGNTHINAIVWSDFKAEIGWTIPAHDEMPEPFFEQSVDAIVVGGVVPKRLAALSRQLKQMGAVLIFRNDLKAPIDIVPRPAKNVGDDRIAAALGALHLDPNWPWIVVDLGTATTINVVRPATAENRPRFEGGLIFPGVSMSLAAMHAKTAQLPKLKAPLSKSSLPFIGKNSSEAMRFGTFHALIGAVTECIRGQLNEIGVESRIALTGGGLTEPVWTPIMQQFPGIVRTAPTLVHLGMYAAWDFQQRRRHG